MDGQWALCPHQKEDRKYYNTTAIFPHQGKDLSKLKTSAQIYSCSKKQKHSDSNGVLFFVAVEVPKCGFIHDTHVKLNFRT